MKALQFVLTDEEFKELQEVKLKSGLNWHDFVIAAGALWDEICEIERKENEI